MRKEHIVLGGIAGVIVVGGLVYVIVTTMSQQRETQRQLDEFKQQVKNAQMVTSRAAESQPAIIMGSSTQNGTVLAKEKATHDVLSEGFRLLSVRDPKQAETAILIFREGIEKVDPKNVEFYRGLGRALIVANHYQEAVTVFDQGQKIDPKNTELWSGQGWAYWNLKDYYHAKLAWEEAIKLNPKSIDAWMVMSWIYLAMQERDKAVTGFRVLVDSGSERVDWKYGLTMARASNFDLKQIRTQFPVPDPALFLTPPAATTSTAPAK